MAWGLLQQGGGEVGDGVAWLLGGMRVIRRHFGLF